MRGCSVYACICVARCDAGANRGADRAAIIEWHRHNVDDSQAQDALVQLYRMAELSGTIDLPLKRAKDYLAAYREKVAERNRLAQAISDATAAKLREHVPGYEPLPAEVRTGKAGRADAPELAAVLDDTTQLRRLGEAAALAVPDHFADLKRQIADMLAASEARMGELLRGTEERMAAQLRATEGRIDALELSLKPLIGSASATADTAARIDSLDRSLRPFAQSAFAARVSGIPLAGLRARFTAIEMKTGGFTAPQLRDAGFTLDEVRRIGGGCHDFRGANLCDSCWGSGTFTFYS